MGTVLGDPLVCLLFLVEGEIIRVTGLLCIKPEPGDGHV